MSSLYSGGVKIIGGQLRGRKLRVIPKKGIRPSSSRTRETLFNWLAPYISGAQCLDLFAGSGAIGLESSSRGANWVTMVDDDLEVVEDLRNKCTELNVHRCDVVRKEAISWLAEEKKKKYDIGYLDPPFKTDLLEQALAQLARGWLSDNALVYVEIGSGELKIRPSWKMLKMARTKKVHYALLTKT